MRTIISNDKTRLYGRIDYNLLEKTKLSQKVLASSQDLPCLNVSGFSTNDFVCINDPGKERSEIRKIDTINGQTISLSTPTSFIYDNKVNVYKMEYDSIRFYGDDTLLSTVSIKPDYLVSEALTISSSVAYSMSFFNTETFKQQVQHLR